MMFMMFIKKMYAGIHTTAMIKNKILDVDIYIHFHHCSVIGKRAPSSILQHSYLLHTLALILPNLPKSFRILHK